MSLTSVLNDVNGPVRRWFEARLPNLKPMQLAWRAAGPPVDLCPEGVKPDVVGTAFDYRLRYFFGPTPARELVAAKGARGHADWPGFAAALDATIERLRPAGRVLGPAGEAELARYCWALALFESPYRMGGRSRTTRTPIDMLGPAPGLDALLGLAPDAGIDELSRLVAKLQTSPLAEMLNLPFCLNPKFRSAGRLVGGADADLLVDGLLVEVKTTKDHTMRRRDGYQLLGYFLLDQSDEYEIKSLGFYLSRVAELVTWPVADLLGQVAGRPVDVADLRAEFASACQSGL